MSKKPVVCDNGTAMIKVGYAGTYIPSHEFRSMIGRPIFHADKKGIVLKDIMVGDEAATMSEFLECAYPLENGIIRDWKDMKILWDYTFLKKLKIDPSEHRILLTESPSNTQDNRKKMYEHMFDVYGFDGAMVEIQPVLPLYAQGLLTGTVLDSGDGVSYAIPVYEGTVLPNTIQRLDVAGKHVTLQLINLLQFAGYSLNRTADFDSARQIKEKLCYVGHDLNVERRLASETCTLVKQFQLPDGRIIKVNRERFEAAEVLFDPNKAGIEAKGLHELLFTAINKAAMDLRPNFYRHVVLSGGTTMFAGLTARLEKEIKELYVEHTGKGDPKSVNRLKLRIEDHPRRKRMVFMGASILADIMKDYDPVWLSKKSWKEKGASRVIAEHEARNCKRCI